MKSCSYLFFLMFLIATSSTQVLAARLISLDIIPSLAGHEDGTFADRLDVVLLFEPGELSATIEVRGFHAVKDSVGANTALAISAVEGAPASEDGKYLLKTNILNPSEDPDKQDAVQVRREIALPLSYIGFDTGVYSYHVTGVTRDPESEELVDFFAKVTDLLQVNRDEFGVRSSYLDRPVDKDLGELRKMPSDVYIIKPDGGFTRETEVIDTFVEHPVLMRSMHTAGEIPPELQGYDVENLEENLEFKVQSQRKIFFATNRRTKIWNSRKVSEVFTSERYQSAQGRGGIYYGSAVVNIPLKTHRRGKLERGSWWWGTQKDKDKAFFIKDGSVKFIPGDKINREFAPGDMMIVIHGFANGFEDALTWTAQFQHDIRFPGSAMTFSWPSVGKVPFTKIITGRMFGEYRKDEDMIASSYNDFTGAILQVLKTKKGRVHLVAHSMGNRLLLNTLDILNRRENWSDNGVKPFKSISLAAADVSLKTFSEKAKMIVAVSERVDFYYSKEDLALKASLHKKKFTDEQMNLRAGLLPVFYEGMTTINADDVNSSLKEVGHSYVSNSPVVLSDFNLNLVRGRERQGRAPALAGPNMLQGYMHWFLKRVR